MSTFHITLKAIRNEKDMHAISFNAMCEKLCFFFKFPFINLIDISLHLVLEGIFTYKFILIE